MSRGLMMNETDLVLCRSDSGDGGWSLHPPGSTDEMIADGSAAVLLSGEAEIADDGEWSAPTAADYAEAMRLWHAAPAPRQ